MPGVNNNNNNNKTASTSSFRPVLAALAAAIVMYWAHRTLKAQYHRHCNSDIFRVVLFSQSTMCSHVATLLQVVEVACGQAVSHVTSHIFSVLNTLVAAGAGKAGGVFGQLARPLFF
jgi:hypothetical protein